MHGLRNTNTGCPGSCKSCGSVMGEKAQEVCANRTDGSVTCTSVTAQYADVSLPIKLRPCAAVGTLVTKCCGDPIITLRPCQGTCCQHGCEFTVTQTVCITVPVEYGAVADAGDTTAVCRQAPCT